MARPCRMALACWLVAASWACQVEALTLHEAQEVALGRRLVRVLLTASADRVDVAASDGSLTFQGADGAWLPSDSQSITRGTLPSGGLVLMSAMGLRLDVDITVGGRSRAKGSLAGVLVLMPSADGRGIQVVNEIGLEGYVAGVVAHEMPVDAPAQALMAQAVAARSFALAGMGKDDTAAYDIASDASAQVYGPVGELSPAIDEAIRVTAGLVLVHVAGIATAYYHSACGGATDAPASVFGASDAPVSGTRARGVRLFGDLSVEENVRRFLAAGVDAPCSASPMYRWERSFSVEEAQRVVTSRGFTPKVGTITELKPLARSEGGRVTKLRLRGTAGCTDVELQTVRWLMNGKAGSLPSTLFVVDPIHDEAGKLTGFVFRGAGYGHGAGLCQFGAMGMARTGASYREILAHYYPSYRIVSLSSY